MRVAKALTSLQLTMKIPCSVSVFFSGGPRLLKMSLYPRHLSEEFRGNLKFILGLRNPKDTAVSFFYHYQRDPLEKFAVPWADFIELFSKGQGTTKL